MVLTVGLAVLTYVHPVPGSRQRAVADRPAVAFRSAAGHADASAWRRKRDYGNRHHRKRRDQKAEGTPANAGHAIARAFARLTVRAGSLVTEMMEVLRGKPRDPGQPWTPARPSLKPPPLSPITWVARMSRTKRPNAGCRRRSGDKALPGA